MRVWFNLWIVHLPDDNPPKKPNFRFKDTYTQYFDKFELLFNFWKCPNTVVGE